MFSKSVLWYRERSQSQGEVLPSEKQKNMIAKLWDCSDEYSHRRSQSRSKQPTSFQFHTKPHAVHTRTHAHISDDRITIDHRPVVALDSQSYACVEY